MSDEPPVDLGNLGDVDVPDLVRPAAARFRRRLLFGGALLSIVAMLAGYAIGWDPLEDSYRARLAGTDDRHLVSTQLAEGDLTLTVLEVGRLDDGLVVVHVVAAAEDLAEDETLTLVVPVNTTVPPPGADTPSGGMQVVGLDPDPGWQVVQAYIGVPAGTAQIPVTFLAGVPATPGVADEPSDGAGSLPPVEPAPLQAPGTTDDLDGLPPTVYGLPPTVEGTGRTLGTITVDLSELSVPPAIWR